MGLKSIFQRQPGEGARKASAEGSPDSVQEARTRARRRLIGAAVLVVIGVIGFPILFETQPRPIPVDIPIEIPRKDGAPPLVMPAPRPSPKPVAAVPQVASAPDEVVTETMADAGREVPAPAASAPAAAKPASIPAKPADARIAEPKKPEPKPEAKPEPKPTRPPETTTAAADAKRAQALLEGKAPEKNADKKDGRFVVQVGAFADTAAARETRQKVEKLGLKTYTQVAETSQGSRIRVRVGPFSSREDAERAQAKIKAAGTSAVVLTL